MPALSLQRSVFILLLLFLVCVGLYYAKPFLVPLAFACLLAMLLIPLSASLESKGWNRALTSLVCVLLVLALVAGVISLVVWQVTDMASDADQIEKNLVKKISELKDYVSERFGVSRKAQQEVIDKQQASSSNNISGMVTKVLASLGTILTNFILLLVYIFLLIYFRTHLKNFVLKLVPTANRAKAVQTMDASRKVAQKYLTGLSLMIVCLWIMYGIGFTIAGVKLPVFFAILCGMLEIIPFIGNLAGTGITVLMSIAQGGESSLIIGILITYALVQFIQTYILEPLVVGHEVNINPLFTILGIVAGEVIWGVPGMILAIPVLGITKIVCDNITSLQPYGFLLGEEKKKAHKPFLKKIKGRFK
ncbi:MAG TPA: AI-2E family transporter [Chitinophagaceae bacterium]|nr:AI-2E family transporter [Chitinophagaceae bacterium]